MMDELEKMTRDGYTPEPGAVYTMLRRMDERDLVVSKWKRKGSGVDRREYTLTDSGVRALKEGLEMVKRRRQLMDNLIHFYDKHFEEKRRESDT